MTYLITNDRYSQDPCTVETIEELDAQTRACFPDECDELALRVCPDGTIRDERDEVVAVTAPTNGKDDLDDEPGPDPDMLEAVQTSGLGEWLTGGEPESDTAEAWSDAGFDADTAQQWWDAAAFDADAAASLRDAGLTPDDCSRAVGEGPCEVETIAYAVSNWDLSAERAAEIVAGATD